MKNKNIILISKSIEKININEIKTNDQKLTEKSYKNKEKDNYNNKFENIYIYNDEIVEKKYENLFLTNNNISNFYIKKDKENSKLNEKEKNIINVKNYLCSSLVNYRILNKSDFNIGTTSDIIEMLKQIKKYISLY